MSATLSPPVRVVGLLGILAAAGLAAFLLFLRPGSGETTGLTPRAAEAQAAAASPASSAAPQAGRPTRPA
ncbi:MAG TPA: hypothetical protein VNJ46_04605, partial [Gaiellaceae bacterium]|nr:hypothetical protein [Gaiellaceae bacterium]